MEDGSETPESERADAAPGDFSGGLTLALFDRACAGKVEARREAVARIEARVIAAVRRRLRGPVRSITETMDVAQSILLSMLGSRSELRFSTDNDLERYVARAITNRMIHLEQAMRRRGLGAMAGDTALGSVDTGGARPDEEVEARENVNVVRQAIDGLPERDREVVRLRVLSGLEFAEIGERLGIGAEAARSRYRRGFEQIRSIISRGSGSE